MDIMGWVQTVLGGGNKEKEHPYRRQATPIVEKPREFGPNDPEFYARSGQANNEADAQRMVNEYREKQYPGIKPLFPNYTQNSVPDYMVAQASTPISISQKLSPYDREAMTQPPVQQRPTVPYIGAVNGASDPVRQVRRGGVPYAPGEGPETRRRYL